MKFKPTFLIFAISILLQTSAFAIDQVTLTSGEILQGTVLNDVPHQHVDIQLVNGTKRRIPRAQVSDVQRDVPSNLDYNRMGSTSQGYFGFLLGIEDNFSTSKSAIFSFGLRGGVSVAQMDSSALGIGLEYNYSKDSSNYYSGTSFTSHDVLLQVLLRRIANSGFYIGPEFGLAMGSISGGAISASATSFQLGAVAGYDFYLNDGFSLGTEIKFDHQFKSDFISMNRGKFYLSGTFHF